MVFNDDNVVELQFRLDFAHYSPPNLDIEDEDEIEIQPDLVFQKFDSRFWLDFNFPYAKTKAKSLTQYIRLPKIRPASNLPFKISFRINNDCSKELGLA